MDEELAMLEAERRRLIGLAYRMLGTTADAEDVVQETYIRWYRMSDEDRAAVTNLQGWLTRTASNICLDILKSARVRREQYVGPWLPEPLPAESLDPADKVTLDDSVSTALLLVLDALSPAERVAFVLHDVFGVPFPEIADVVGRSPAAVRQLATSARRHVHAARSAEVPTTEHAMLVRAFAAACESGDLDALMAVLDPSVELRSDGGGLVKAAINPVVGDSNVSRFLLGVLVKQTEWSLALRQSTDGLAVTFVRDGAVVGVVNLHAAAGRIHDIWMVLNPEKLSGWQVG